MKSTIRILWVAMLILGSMFSMSYAGAEKYGQEISSRQVIAVKDILANPKNFDGKLVTIQGKIASECPSGCWFYVKVDDGNAEIYVDIGKSGFAIPQYKGKKLLVEGTVVVKQGGVMIQGRGVEIQ